MLGKLYSVARLLALLVAIVGAFTTIPQAGVALLVLGGIAGIGVEKADQGRMILIALLLTMSSGLLDVIPEVGGYLSSIFGSIGLATVGGSIVAIGISVVLRVKGDWVKSAKKG